MLSYYYYVEYLSRILDSYSYSTRCKYSFWQTYTPFLRDLLLLSFVSPLLKWTCFSLLFKIFLICFKFVLLAEASSVFSLEILSSMCVHLSGVFQVRCKREWGPHLSCSHNLGDSDKKLISKETAHLWLWTLMYQSGQHSNTSCRWTQSIHLHTTALRQHLMSIQGSLHMCEKCHFKT